MITTTLLLEWKHQISRGFYNNIQNGNSFFKVFCQGHQWHGQVDGFQASTTPIPYPLPPQTPALKLFLERHDYQAPVAANNHVACLTFLLNNVLSSFGKLWAAADLICKLQGGSALTYISNSFYNMHLPFKWTERLFKQISRDNLNVFSS